MDTLDVDYFIKKFEAIPENKWTTGVYEDEDARCCALGHCGATEGKPINPEESALTSILIGFAAPINDGRLGAYQQNTPKQRILAALNDVKRGMYEFNR